jgi:hypothetical protein
MNDPMYYQRPGPMPFRLLIDEAIRQARRHFKTLYPPIAIPLAVCTTLLAAAQVLWFSSIAVSPETMSFGSPAVILLAIANLGLLMVSVMALQSGVMDALAGRPVDMKRAWRFAVQGRVLGTAFLCYVASVLSIACCCIPALVVVPIFSFAPPVLVEEGRSVSGSISRGSDLALYDPGQGFLERPLVKVLLLLVVGVILSTVLGLLVAMPFQLPMYIDIFRQTAAGEDTVPDMMKWLWLQVPAQFFSTLASTALYVYLSFGIGLLYYDTRGRKEGVDLRSEIDEVFGAPPPELPLG